MADRTAGLNEGPIENRSLAANAAKGNNESDARYFKRFSEAMRNARQRLGKIYKNQGGQVSPIKC